MLLSLLASAVAGPPLLQVGLTAPYAVQPGLRLGYRHPLLSWEGRASEASLLLGGDAAGFVAFNDHLSASLGPSAGVLWQRERLGLGLEAGLSLVGDWQTLGYSVDLGSEALTPDRAWRLNVLPTLSGRLSWGQGRVGGYAGASVGPELALGREGAMWFSAELGLQLRLGGTP